VCMIPLNTEGGWFDSKCVYEYVLNSFWYIMWYMVFSSRTVSVPNIESCIKRYGLKLVDGEGKLGV
jgi:hypothetical protein